MPRQEPKRIQQQQLNFQFQNPEQVAQAKKFLNQISAAATEQLREQTGFTVRVTNSSILLAALNHYLSTGSWSKGGAK